jgi:hypothetical protein
MEYDGGEACSFFDEDEETDLINQVSQNTLYVDISAIAFIAENAKKESTDLIADIIHAVGSDRSWGGLALSTGLGKNEKEIEAMGRRACRVKVEIEIIYRTNPFDY